MQLKALKRKALYNNIQLRIAGLIFLAGLLNSFQLSAQSKEIGAGIASFNYVGDLQRQYKLSTQTIGFQAYYIRNFQKGWSGKVALATANIKGSDTNPFDDFAAIRSASFKDNLTEVTGSIQYDFLDFRERKDLVKFSPFVSVGAGLFLINRVDKNAEYSSIQFAIPFGGGIRFNLGPLWTLNFEFSARKTFYDYLDNISEQEIVDKSSSSFQYGNWADNDWYYFAGLSLSYTFWNVNCPDPINASPYKK